MDDKKKRRFKVGWRTPESLTECKSDLRTHRQKMIAEAKELDRYVWLLKEPESSHVGKMPATEQEYAERDKIVERLKRMLASHAEEIAFVRADKARIRAVLFRVREDARQMKLQGTADAYGDSIRQLEQELLDAECVERDHLAAEQYARMALDRQRLRPCPGKEEPRKYPPLVLPELPNPAEGRKRRGDSSREESMSTQVCKLIEDGPLWK